MLKTHFKSVFFSMRDLSSMWAVRHFHHLRRRRQCQTNLKWDSKNASCRSKSRNMLISQPCLRWCGAGTDGWIHSGGEFWSTLMLLRISRFCLMVMWFVSLVASFILKPVAQNADIFFYFCAKIKSNREVTGFYLWTYFGSQKSIINKWQNPTFTLEFVSLLRYEITKPEWRTKAFTNKEQKDRISRLAT